MSQATEPFGRAALRLSEPGALLELERATGRNIRFDSLDALVGAVIVQVLRGQRMVRLSAASKQGEKAVMLGGITAEQQSLLDDLFSAERQQARGAWFLPADASLKLGLAHLPADFETYGRFASTPVWDDRAKVRLASSASAVFAWAVVEPLFEALFLPFALRGWLAGTHSREEQRALWNEVDAFYNVLGLAVDDELAVMRYGCGWSKLRASAQFAAKQRLLAALARQAVPEMGARYRAVRLHALIEGYYKKAKDGRVRRRQALTKPLQRTLSGFFGGDWLALLDYLAEEPHPDEQVVTALPETRLYVGGTTRATEVAAAHGIPVEEVERMLAGFWQQESASSPVEQRVAVLERYWQAFDVIHTRQTVGMAPLWGLVDDSRLIDFAPDPAGPYRPGLYRELLPVDLSADIERLWGTTMLARWPDRIVSEPFPHVALAETFGPALEFWHGCALTAWFICEGPYSRTSLAGMREYYGRQLVLLEEAGAPVDPRLFEELVAAEGRLGPPQPLTRKSSTLKVGDGLHITFEMSLGSRRDGFEFLRDIVTRYRRAWSEQYLTACIRRRWEHELREAARAHGVLLSDRGKAPTMKQFARAVETATNHWFGGDIGALYGAIGEKVPAQPERRASLPSDRIAFAHAVFSALGGTPFRWNSNLNASPDSPEYKAQVQANERYQAMSRLANHCCWYMQLEEALGRPPEIKEFGPSKFEPYAWVLDSDLGEAWHIYTAAVKAAQRIPLDSTLQPEPVPTTPVRARSSVANSSPPAITTTHAQARLDNSAQAGEAQGVDEKPKRSWLDRLLRRS